MSFSIPWINSTKPTSTLQGELAEHTRGYLDGLTDERNCRTPEHSRSVYAFPRQGTEAEKASYNAGYYEAKRAYREERQRLESEAL